MIAAPAVVALLQAAGSAEAAYRAGLELYQQGQAEEARVYFERAVKAAPTARHWRALGTTDASLGYYDRAEAALAQACRLDPQEEGACYHHGRVLFALDRFEAALAALEAALRVEPNPWRVRVVMAQALEPLGRAAEAEAHYRRAIELAGDSAADPDPQFHLGIFLFRQGRTEEAARELQGAVKRNPESAETRYRLARALIPLGRLQDAIWQLRHAVELNHRHTEAHRLLAQVYRRVGRPADAERHAQLAAQGSATSR
jgi:tetratricopeptide (TPR) repeat protein